MSVSFGSLAQIPRPHCRYRLQLPCGISLLLLQGQGGHREAGVARHARRPLDGRQSAGSNFRDYFEEVVGKTPQARVTRGVLEPTVFRGDVELEQTPGEASRPKWVMTHHIDDGWLIAPDVHSINVVVEHLRGYFILKVSDIIMDGTSMSYLKRDKTGTRMAG